MPCFACLRLAPLLRLAVAARRRRARCARAVAPRPGRHRRARTSDMAAAEARYRAGAGEDRQRRSRRAEAKATPRWRTWRTSSPPACSRRAARCRRCWRPTSACSSSTPTPKRRMRRRRVDPNDRGSDHAGDVAVNADVPRGRRRPRSLLARRPSLRHDGAVQPGGAGRHPPLADRHARRADRAATKTTSTCAS